MTLPRSVIALFIYFVVSVNSQSDCKTPVGEAGFCIPAKQCSIIVNIIMDSPKPLPQKALDYLKNSHCRTENDEHYACCSPRHLTIPIPTPSPAAPRGVRSATQP